MSLNWVILDLSPLGEKTERLDLIRDSLIGLGAGAVFIPAMAVSMGKEILPVVLFEGYVFARVGIPRYYPVAEAAWADATPIAQRTGSLSRLAYRALASNKGCDLSCSELVEEISRLDSKAFGSVDPSQNYRTVYTVARRISEIKFGGGRFWVPSDTLTHPRDLEASPYVSKVMTSEYVDGRGRRSSRVCYVTDADIAKYRQKLLRMIPVFSVGQQVRVLGGVYRQMVGEVIRYRRDSVHLKLPLRTLSVEADIPPVFLESVVT